MVEKFLSNSQNIDNIATVYVSSFFFTKGLMTFRRQNIMQFKMQNTFNTDLLKTVTQNTCRKIFGAATLSVDVVQDVFVARSSEAGVVHTAGVDGPLILSGHDQLDLTPHTVELVVVREWSKVNDGVDLFPVVPGPLQVDVLGIELLHPTAENQQPLHFGNLRDAGDLEERWLHWRCVSVCNERRGQW